jgi:putative transposase
MMITHPSHGEKDGSNCVTPKNLKLIASFGGFFLTRRKRNRLVNPDRQGDRPIREVEIPTEGRVAHRKGFGLVRVFRTVSPNGDAEYGATHDRKRTEEKREELEKRGWKSILEG